MTGKPATETDPYWSSTSLLVKTNTGSIVEVAKGSTLTSYGAISVSSSVERFSGEKSISISIGAGGHIRTPKIADYDFGNGNCTVEAWVYPTVVNGTHVFASSYNGSNGWWFRIQGSYLQCGIGDNTITTRTSSTVPENTWSHVAMCQNSGYVTLYLNGNSGGSQVLNSGALTSTNPTFTIGELANGSYGQFFNGYMSNLRLTKAVARYTANFTPPTAAFPTA